MAENDAERTERPTPKRLEEARRKGQIPRSRDLSTAAVMLAGGAGLYTMGGKLGEQLNDIMRSGLSLSREQVLNEQTMLTALAAAGRQTLVACVPILGLIMAAALIAPLALGGWAFSTGALAPKFSRLNPAAGLKRMVSMRGLIELGKALAKFGLVGFVAVMVLRNNMAGLLALGSEPVQIGMTHAAKMVGSALLALSGSLGFIALIDVPYQLWQYNKELRMTREEVRQEMRESEGAPEIKSRIRSMQQLVARRRMMQEVPKADVIITNPTHFAVALRYDDKRMGAPIVVAKGADLIAARIRESATENSVPIVEAPPLARALFRNVEVGGEIPATLYVAVAQVLTYIFQLRTAKKTGAVPPALPDVKFDEANA